MAKPGTALEVILEVIGTWRGYLMKPPSRRFGLSNPGSVISLMKGHYQPSEGRVGHPGAIAKKKEKNPGGFDRKIQICR